MTERSATRFPHIASSQKTVLSPWATLVENRVVTAAHDDGAVYHAIATADYVSILAVTADGRIPLVRQFRPALDRFTLEFPGGMRDGDEAPDACAIRELAEETGLQVPHAEPLAQFHPDFRKALQPHVDVLRPRCGSNSRLASGKRGRAYDGGDR